MNDDEDEFDQHSREMLGRMDERIKSLRSSIERIEAALVKYVTRVEFWPVKAIAYGLAGLVLTAVVAALLAKVMK